MNHIIRMIPLVGAILLWAGLAASSPASAQVPAQEVARLSLDEALARFGRNNLELQLARAEAAEATALARQAAAYPNPSLTATHEPLSGGDRSYSESYFNLSQRFEWPGTRSALGDAASRSADAASARLLADSARLAFEVKEAYVRAAAAQRAEAVLARATELFRSGEARAAERHEEGDISLYDWRRIRVERFRYEARLAEASLEAASARRRLALLIAPEDEVGQIAPTDSLATLPPTISTERARGNALERRAELAAAAASLASARGSAAAARGTRIPDVTATAGYKTQSDGFTGAFLGLSVPVPLWDRRAGAIEGADVRVRAAEHRVALARRQVENDVARAWDTYASYRSAELPRATEGDGPGELIEIAQVAYDEGEMELLDLLDAVEALMEARLAEVRLRAAFWTSYYDLERAVGGFDAPADEGGTE